MKILTLTLLQNKWAALVILLGLLGVALSLGEWIREIIS